MNSNQPLFAGILYALTFSTTVILLSNSTIIQSYSNKVREIILNRSDIVSNSIQQVNSNYQGLRDLGGQYHYDIINHVNSLNTRFDTVNNSLTQVAIEFRDLTNQTMELKTMASRHDAILDRIHSTVDNIVLSTENQVARLLCQHTDISNVSLALRDDAKEIKEVAEVLQNSRFVNEQGQVLENVYKSIETSLEKFFPEEFKQILTNFYTEKLNLTGRFGNLSPNVNLSENIEVSQNSALNFANQNSDLIKSAFNTIRNSRSQLTDVQDEAVLIKPIIVAGLASLNLDAEIVDVMSEFVGQCVKSVKIHSLVRSDASTE